MKLCIPARWLALLAPACLAACGARTALDDASASAVVLPAEGAPQVPDASAAPPPPTCPAWIATHAAVQVSNTPSIVELMAALPTPAGVLTGYADAQLPPVDSDWHARLVAFGDGALGAERTVLHRNWSLPGWTRISLAQGFGRAAATASDGTDGMFFVTIDGTGAPTGTPRDDGKTPGRYLLATPSGFSVLRSPFDPSGVMAGPVSLAALDDAGQITHEETLLDASPPIVGYSRVAFADGSFLLVWGRDDACAGCRSVEARHFSEAGAALAPAVTLHAFGAESYGSLELAVSPAGVLAVWTESDASGARLVAEPFDANGQVRGAPVTFATLPGEAVSAFALTEAPGGHFLVGWVDGLSPSSGQVHVQSVGADGAAEGPAAALGTTVAPSAEEDLLVVASPEGAMVLYESDVPGFGIEVYAMPLRCAR